MRSSERLLAMLLLCVLIPLEAVCTRLAYHTCGEITSCLYWMAVSANLAFVVLLFRHPVAAALGMLALGLVVIPYQLVLSDRLLRLPAESVRIIAWSYEGS